jgi:hypothetical protein
LRQHHDDEHEENNRTTSNILLFREWNGVKFPKGAHTVSGIPVPSIPETTTLYDVLFNIHHHGGTKQRGSAFPRSRMPP